VLLRAGGAAGPAPTIIVLHGYTGTPTGIERYAELTAAANEAGVVVAYPEGTPTRDGGFGWNTGASIFSTGAADDVAALSEMLDALVATGCVDPAHVILTGESNGGAMALVAGCDAALSGRFTRLVLVNAAVDAGVLDMCDTPPVPPPITVVAGRLDGTVPVEGSDRFLPVDHWFAETVKVAGRCATVEDTAPLTGLVSRRIGVDCANCTELLIIADGTHTWPGTSQGVDGLTPGTLDLNGLLISAARVMTSGCLTAPS
jgi:poly(3-hydroxybutyrate) depolymerase